MAKTETDLEETQPLFPSSEVHAEEKPKLLRPWQGADIVMNNDDIVHDVQFLSQDQINRLPKSSTSDDEEETGFFTKRFRSPI